MSATYRTYLLRKVAGLLVTVLLITSLNFFIFQVLPGDPTRILLPRGGGSPTDVINTTRLRDQLVHEWGLDRPVYERFGIYLWNLLHGNWGTTITYKAGNDVWAVILPSLANTLVLTGVGTVVAIYMGIKLGLFAGWRRGKRADETVVLSSLLLYSMPTFWLAIALIFIFAVYLPLLPVGGSVTPIVHDTLDVWGKLADRGIHLVLPLAAFILNEHAIFTLIMRNSLIEELSEDYMTTARAKGLSERQQLRRHAVPNARLPVSTLVALYIGWILSGAIVIEVVFGLNGVGNLTYEAVVNRDYPLLSAIFLVGTLGVIVANAILDVLYSYLDPRVTEA